MDRNELDGLAGREISGFLMLRELGQGSNGVVYLAKQLLLDREVACKILLPEYAASPEYVERFVHEARLVARMEHPNIVQALDVGSTPDGFSYFVMEYVPGKNLEDIRLEEPERLSEDFLLDIFASLAGALDYAWNSHGITHGDIKPGNLLIRDADGVLKLADLGLARINGSTPAGELMATPLYVAPEVIRGEPGGVGSDIYSFGVMFYELLAGRPPFRGDIDVLLEQHLHRTPPPLIVSNPDADREISDFIGRMLEKHPEQRPRSWAEIGAFLDGVRRRRRAGSGVADPRLRSQLDALASGGAARENRSGVWLLAAVAVAVVATLIFLAVSLID